MIKFLISFTLISLINVIFSTIKSILTVTGDKWTASLTTAFYYSFYNIVLIYTVSDFPLLTKCIITFVCNLVGVYIVKFCEKKFRKDRVWVFNAICKESYDRVLEIDQTLKKMGIVRVFTEVLPDQLYTMQIFSNSIDESNKITKTLENYNVKCHAYETMEF